MNKPHRPGRPTETDSHAAKLLLGMFESYQEAAAEFKLSRSAIQLWAKKNRIPGPHLKRLRTRAADKRHLTRLFNRLTTDPKLTIGH